MIKIFLKFDRLFLVGKNSYNNKIVSNVRKTCCLVGQYLFWVSLEFWWQSNQAKLANTLKNFAQFSFSKLIKQRRRKTYRKFSNRQKEHSIAENVAVTWMVWDEKVSKKQALKFTNAEGMSRHFEIVFAKIPTKPKKFSEYFLTKKSLKHCRTFYEKKIGLVRLGQEKLGHKVRNLGRCHEICEKKHRRN